MIRYKEKKKHNPYNRLHLSIQVVKVGTTTAIMYLEAHSGKARSLLLAQILSKKTIIKEEIPIRRRLTVIKLDEQAAILKAWCREVALVLLEHPFAMSH